MAITAVGYGAQTVLNTGTEITPALHASTAEDDLIVASILSAGNRTVTIDASYTEITNYYNATANFRFVVGYKIAGASESDPTHTISTSGSGWAAQCATYRGVDTSTPIDVTSVTSQLTSTATTFAPTGITTSTNGAWVLSLVAAGQGISVCSLGLNSGNEQGFTLEMGGDNYDYTTANDMSFGQAYKEQATAGAVTCPTWERTVGSDNYWNGVTVALRPATASTLPMTLTPNADGTRSNVLNENTGTADLYTSVDDDPDTPTTTNWISAFDNDGYVFLDMTPTPDNFGDAVSLEVRASVEAALFTTDQSDLYAQVFAANETTTYTDEVLFATEASDGLVTASFTINATGLAATKSAWDTARIKLRWDYTA